MPDKILGKIGSGPDQARSDSFLLFESEFKSPRSQGVDSGDFSNAFESLEMITGDNEQYSCEETSQLPISQPGTDSSSAIDSKSIDKPSFVSCN